MQHILFSLVSAIIGIHFLVVSARNENSEIPSFEHYDVESIVANATPMPYADIAYESKKNTVSLNGPADSDVPPVIAQKEAESVTPIPVTESPSPTITPTITLTVTPTCTEASCNITTTPTPSISVSPSVTTTSTPSPTGTANPLVPAFDQPHLPSPTPFGNSCTSPSPQPGPEHPHVCL